MSTTHDKHGHEIKKGDIVEVVHFGEHHTFAVEEIHEEAGHHYLTGSVTIRVPATAASRRKDENPKAAPREDTKVEHHTETKAEAASAPPTAPKHTTHHTAAAHKPAEKGKK